MTSSKNMGPVLVGPMGLDVIVDQDKGEPLVQLGGVMRNVAANLALLGISCTYFAQSCARVVDALGYNGVVPEGVDLRWLKLDEESFGFYFAGVRRGDVIFAEADYSFAEEVFSSDIVAEIRSSLCGTGMLISCTDVSRGFWEKSAAVVRSCGGLACLMASGLPMPADYVEWVEHADILFLNKDELISAGLSKGDLEAITHEGDGMLVFVTHGKEGVDVYDNGQRLRYEAPSLVGELVWPVGAGDAFAAGVIAGIFKGGSRGLYVKAGLSSSTRKLLLRSNTLWEAPR